MLVFGEPESSWVELVRRGPFEADIDADVFFLCRKDTECILHIVLDMHNFVSLSI